MKSKQLKKMTNSKDTKAIILEILRMVKYRHLLPSEAKDLISEIITLQQAL